MKLTIITLIYCIPFVVFAQSTEQLSLALQYYNSGNYSACIEACDLQLKTHYEQAQTYLIRGKANIENGFHTLAIADLTSSIQNDKKNAEAYNLRGYCYFLLNDYVLARTDFIEACYLDKKTPLYFYNLGNVEQHMLKIKEAIKSYTTAIQLKPYYADAYMNRGHIYLAKNDFTLAIQDLDSSLKYNQNNEEIFLYRGMALASLKRYKEAINMFNRCIRLKPTDAAAYYSKGSVYCQLKDYKTAVANFDTAIALKPTLEIAYFNRALSLLELDNILYKYKACADFSIAVKLGYLEAVAYLKKYCE